MAIWNCGHVLSRKAFKEVKTEKEGNDSKICLVCQEPYTPEDVIDMNL